MRFREDNKHESSQAALAVLVAPTPPPIPSPTRTSAVPQCSAAKHRHGYPYSALHSAPNNSRMPVIRSETCLLRVGADSDCSLEASLPPPLLRLLPGGANQFPGGFNSRCGPSPFTAHPVCPLLGRKTIGELPESNPHENAFIAL
jgi:hypothetical protein